VSVRTVLRIVLAIPVVLATAERGFAQTQPADSDVAQRDLLDQQAILADRSSSQEQKDEAARRLISRQSESAQVILMGVLEDAANPAGRLAVARAVAHDPNPPRQFIQPLGRMLYLTERGMAEAAAHALARFPSEPSATALLLRFLRDVRQPVASRIAAARAVGTLVDKQAAAALIEVLNSDSNQQVVRAAAEALGEMSGLRDYGVDIQRWNQWWIQNRARRQEDWANELAARKAREAGETRARYEALRQQVSKMLEERYREARDEQQKNEILLRYLTSELPEFRIVGVRIIFSDFIGRNLPNGVRARLWAMVGDSSREVRQEVARTLGALNDPGAVDALLAQLPQEADTDVRAAIAAALGPSRDLRAVEPLTRLLDDPQFSVARSAADSLRQLAAALHQDPPSPAHMALARKVAAALRSRFAATPATAATERLRESLAWAMAQFPDSESLSVFYAMLTPERESLPAVRRAAAAGLAMLGNPAVGDALLSSLKNDPDTGVRLEAASALEKVGSFAHVPELVRRLDESVEAEPAVRARCWQVIVKLAPLGTDRELLELADRFLRSNPEDWSRRLEILRVLKNRLDGAEQHQEVLAAVNVNMAEVLMRLEKPAGAAGQYRAALEYWKSQNAPAAVLDPLTQKLMDALLAAQQYREAVDFFADSVRSNAEYRGLLGAKLMNEADRLRQRRRQDALELIEESRRIRPLLGKVHAEQLKVIEQELLAAPATGPAASLRTTGPLRQP